MPPRKKTPRNKSTPLQPATPEYVRPPSGPSNLLIILLIAVSFFAGYLFFRLQSLEQGKKDTVTQNLPQKAQPVALGQIKKLFSNDYIHFGNADKKVLFAEILDPSCPYCHVAGGRDSELSKQTGRFQYITNGGTYTPPVPEMRKLVDEGKASYAVIYSPGHGNGEVAMETLYCAFDSGKFWEVHDKLMSYEGYTLINDKVQNNKANVSLVVNFLGDIVDPQTLKTCIESGKYDQRLQKEQQLSQALGFQGTPHFFVNTTSFGGAYDYKQIQPVVDSALK
ncbi:DsbA family protein [Candidatus Roizmanbacteria bacterium]|nr:DsbA family protein [Candidatus Roizmanbacteria bacterium]